MNGELVFPCDYEDIIKNILYYCKVMDKYDSYITKQLLPMSEEGSILDNLYNSSSKKKIGQI